MRRALHMIMMGLALWASPAGAAQDGAVKDVVPSAEREGVVHVNAMKNPEMRAYRALVAGLDRFDAYHAHAPTVPKLLFQVQPTRGGALEGEPPQARIAADDFSLPLVLDADGRFTVPRNQAAWDAKAELLLNRKRREVKVEPYIRTPGLAANQRRLGDIRLECQVKVAIAKEEIPFFWVATINTLLLTTDWCGWFNEDKRHWSVGLGAGPKLAAAILREGERSKALHIGDRSFSAPIGDSAWSDEALIDLEFVAADESSVKTEPGAVTP